MKLKLALLMLVALVAAGSSARAGGDGIPVPAPIAVPVPIPIEEGFTYYFRADIGYGWAKAGDFSERGLIYGEDAAVGFGPFNSSAIAFTDNRKDVLGGTVGIGAYLTRWLRGDITLDFRGDQTDVFSGAYSYPYAPAPGSTVNGSIFDTLKVNSTVGLVNIYIEPLPRGMFTPYIGAGIGFVYNDIERTYLNTEELRDGANLLVGTRSRTATAKENAYELAAALMAGVAFAIDHRWALDVGYRALYMGGVSTSVTVNSIATGLPPTQTSTATLGDTWEHQVRVGVRVNLW